MNSFYPVLGCTTLLPVAVSVLLQRPKAKALFEKMSSMRRSIFCGIIYGLLTCLIIAVSTVPLFGNTGNASYLVDAPSIIAGLLFDFPAGLIAAGIGAVYRYESVLWAGESMMRLSGVAGLLLSGCLASLVKKSFFNDHYKPNFIHAVSFAVLIEVYSYTLIFLFNLKHLYEVSIRTA